MNPIKYINEETIDEEPMRLFYCEDDNTYSPIVKKNKKEIIKRKGTHPPQKRKRLFSVHTHPDLELLWKIKEGSIDLNKAFCQGVLDVDVNWGEKRWEEKLSKVKAYMDEHKSRPSSTSKDKAIKTLGIWISTSTTKLQKESYIMKDEAIRLQWEEFVNDARYKEYFMSDEDSYGMIH